jgi:hypothetical protein
MTWWGTLSLALTLYGAIVVLEWVYSRFLPVGGFVSAPITVAVYVHNQESLLEQAVANVRTIWQESEWPGRDRKVTIMDGGSTDQTLAIAKRLERRFPFVTVARPGADKGQILEECRSRVLIWVDLTTGQPPILLETLRAVLQNAESPSIRPTG